MKKEIIWFIFIIAGAAVAGIANHNGGIPFFGKMLAQVGITVGVAPNPYNSLDAQLNQKQTDLERQQADLAAREAAFTSSTADPVAQTSPYLWYILGAIGVLALLVGFNFYFDWRRSVREEKEIAARGDATIKE